jgi:hypothetical protein
LPLADPTWRISRPATGISHGKVEAKGDEFDDLIREAMEAPIAGWDFSWIRDRSSVDRLPWHYGAVVARYAAGAQSMLDMGTGGGEVLSSLDVRAPTTVAKIELTSGAPASLGRALS